MSRYVATPLSLVLAVLLTLSSSDAFPQSEGGGFEGWNQKEGEKPSGKDQASQPTAEPTAAPETRPPEVGAGANAPGSQPGLLPSVSTQYGSLTLLGVFQTLLNSQIHVEDAPAGHDHFDTFSFDFQRARIILKGHVVSEDFGYFFQGDARNSESFALDMFLSYKLGSSGLSLRVGRFVPEFSYMMPRNTADLSAINYPLYLTVGRFSVWRQIGVEAAFQASDQINLRFGMFNGLIGDPAVLDPAVWYMQMGQIPVVPGMTYPNYTDNNKAKDFMFRGSFKPSKELSIDLNLWLAMPVNLTQPDKNDLLFMGGPGMEYNDGKLHVISEFMFRVLSFGQDNAPDSRIGLGAWLHGGYRFTDLVEGIFRIDWVDGIVGDNANDMLMRFTAGPHFWIEEKHFRILANLYFDLPIEGENRTKDMGLQLQFAALW